MTSATPRSTLTVFRAAAVCTVIAVALGSVVCATESGFECGTWPGCTDGTLLPDGAISTALYRNPWIEMVHRTSAILTGPLAVAALVLALRLRRAGRASLAVVLLPVVTIIGAIIAGYVGRGIVLGVEYPTWVGALDLGAAVLAMVAILTATVLLERGVSVRPERRVAGWAWAAFASTLALHLVSLFVAGAGSYTRCVSWPIAKILPVDAEAPAALHVARFALAGLGAAATVVAATMARRHRVLHGEAIAAVVALVLVLALALVITLDADADLGVLFSIASVALLVTQVLLAARATSGIPVKTRPIVRDSVDAAR